MEAVPLSEVPESADHLAPGAAVPAVENRIAVATQWQLMWWRFRKHRLAMFSAIIVGCFYLVVLGADFLAYADPFASEAQRSLIAPQPIHLFDQGQFRPHIYALTGKRDPKTFKRVYTPDPNKKLPIRLFAQGFKYKLLGVIPTDRHLIGIEGAKVEETFFVLGTDVLGRDVWSRLIYATRTSLTIGLAGVTLSLLLGIVLGGISALDPRDALRLEQRLVRTVLAGERARVRGDHLARERLAADLEDDDGDVALARASRAPRGSRPGSRIVSMNMPTTRVLSSVSAYPR